MKTLFKGVVAMLLIAMLFGACDMFAKDEDPGSGVSFTSTDTDPVIRVRNNTSKRLVAFKGSLSAETLIGGIPANAKSHGFAKSALFYRTEDFPMVLITEEDYKANKENLSTLEDKPFTRVYVFYNAQGENTNIYDISGRLGGNYKLTLINKSGYNAEIRLGGVNGETIGYAPNGMLTTTLYVDEGDFDLFPIFKKYNAYRDTVDTIYPTAYDGYAWYYSLGFENTPTGREKRFDVQDAVSGMTKQSSGVAWVAINNQAKGAVHLIMDGNPIKTTAGVSYFEGSKTFQLDMNTVPKADGSFKFSESKAFVLKVGPNGREVEVKRTDEVTGALTLKADTQYQVTVTGDPNAGTLKAVIEMDEEKDLGPEPVEL